MYVDDVTALNIARLYELRQSIKEASDEAEILRKEIEAVMDVSGEDILTTDTYSVVRSRRTTLRIDRKALEQAAPEIFREVAIIGNSNVIHIDKR